MITQTDLIEELRRRGYGAITPRWLVFARQQGLLPKLSHRGRGRGQGSSYFIRDPDTVIEQAITVYELLRRHNRTETALLSTWFAGFEMPIRRMRTVWVARMDREENQLVKLSGAAGRDNVIYRWSNSITRKLAVQHNLDYNDASEVIQEILNSIYDPQFEIEVDAVFEPFLNTFAALAKDKNKRESRDLLTEQCLQSSMDFFRQIASLKWRCALISSATDEELWLAHHLWRRIGKTIRQFVIEYEPRVFSGPGIPVSRQMAIAFAGVGILSLLYLTKFDGNSSVSRTIDLIDQWTERLTKNANFCIYIKEIKDSNKIPKRFNAPFSEFWDAARSIWAKFDFAAFKRNIAVHSDQIDQ